MAVTDAKVVAGEPWPGCKMWQVRSAIPEVAMARSWWAVKTLAM